MSRSIRLVLGAMAFAVALTLAPVSLSSNTGLEVGPTSVCGQADECKWSLFYMCSTHNDDHKDYRCSSGCDQCIDC